MRLILIIPMLSLCVGCAVDNAFLASLPLFEAQSDTIPGLQPPYKRLEQIELKGEKGAGAPDAEKEVLVAQLMTEYRSSPDHNMRRAAVDAMAKIPHRKRDEYMKEILNDGDPMVRISALEAICKIYNGPRDELVDLLIERMKRDQDKDVRLIAVKGLGEICAASKSTAVSNGTASNNMLSRPGIRSTRRWASGQGADGACFGDGFTAKNDRPGLRQRR